MYTKGYSRFCMESFLSLYRVTRKGNMLHRWCQPHPQYPVGIPILAIFMIVAYGVIRRKTRPKSP
jgi:hypothetical protein